MSPSEGIVVLGVPRSGTTLMQQLLDGHPEIAAPPETYLLASCGRFLASERTATGLEVGVESGLQLAGFDSGEVVTRLQGLVFGILGEHAAEQEAAWWSEKSTFGVFHLPEIERLCGDRVRYVVLVRHGLDVATSLLDLCEHTGRYLGELHPWVTRWASPIEAFAHLWADRTTALLELAERHRSRAVVIRYEDLVRSPEIELGRVLEILGAEPIPDIRAWTRNRSVGAGLGDWKALQRTEIDEASVGRWKRLPEALIADLAPVVAPLLARLGYDPIEVAPGDHQRRNHLAQLLAAARRRST